MEGLPYIPGLQPADPGPLSRFLPALEEGVISTWLSQHSPASTWLLDPFGFAPRLVLEAARAGYQVLVTANNPITRFLVEMAANPPSESDFKAALADLAVSKKGDERLEAHLQFLYETTCAQCGRPVTAQAFFWRKGEAAPYARLYECRECGDTGEREVTPEDVERARKIAATDHLPRSRAFERVVALDDDDRVYAEEAIEHYLPRPLYILTTLINRLDGLNLSPERKRALSALILVACDAGNTLWGYPAGRVRPKQLSTPNQFRENNLWTILEHALTLWTETAAGVPCVSWPNKLPESGGVCIYEGRLKDLAHLVKKEIPISAVIGSIPRPNQAFWTLSALWAGWLWGREAVEPYKIALRRRRYDWAWNATALSAAFSHLFDLLPLGTPVFGLLPEPEPAFLTSALTAAGFTGFDLQGLALRTPHDPIQILWKRGEHLHRETTKPDADLLPQVIQDHLSERGEPVDYLHLHAAALMTLVEHHALKDAGQGMDESIRMTHALVETALKTENRFIHYSGGEGLDTGLWGVSVSGDLSSISESLADRVEIAIVSFLQKNPKCIFLEIEDDLYPRFPGLLTPSKGLIYAVLDSYARKEGGSWSLRSEDRAATRREEIKQIETALESIGERLGYRAGRRDRLLIWEERHQPERFFIVLASALVGRTLAEIASPPEQTMLVIPGGRAGLIAYKQQRDGRLAEQMRSFRILKYRLVRNLLQLPILTRETFLEQIASDPVEQTKGQMMMF